MKPADKRYKEIMRSAGKGGIPPVQADVLAACRMLEDGYPMEEVLPALRRGSAAAKASADPAQYMEEVLAGINPEFHRQRQGSYKLARTAYRLRMRALQKKFAGYHGKALGAFQEGSIVLAMLLKDKFQPETVEEVLRKNSPSWAKPGYVSGIMQQCRMVLQRYSEIRAFRPPEREQPGNAGDVYRQYAKAYQDRTSTILLNGRDERNIIRSIYAALYQLYRKDFPKMGKLELGKLFEQDAAQQIRPFLMQALEEASPVAVEPGRDKSEYITSLMMDFRPDGKERQPQVTLEGYNRMRGLATEGVKGVSAMTAYKDGRMAVRMLQGHVERNEIREMLMRAFQPSEENRNMDVGEYAEDILFHADKVCQRMQAIIDYDFRPGEARDIREDYIQKFRPMLLQKGFAQTSMDTAVVRAMLLERKYAPEAIRAAVQEFSPNAAEAGRDEEYREYIEMLAQKSINEEKQKLEIYQVIPRQEDREEDAGKEYEHHRHELLQSIDLPYSTKMDVMIASAMLLQGYEKMEIADALTKSPANERHEERYGAKILARASHGRALQQGSEPERARVLAVGEA